jgi:hypothetical protein
VKCYIWSVTFYGAEISGSRSETPGKFWNVVLEKDGEDQLDRSCEDWKVLHRVKEKRNILHTRTRISHLASRTAF